MIIQYRDCTTLYLNILRKKKLKMVRLYGHFVLQYQVSR